MSKAIRYIFLYYIKPTQSLPVIIFLLAIDAITQLYQKRSICPIKTILICQMNQRVAMTISHGSVTVQKRKMQIRTVPRPTTMHH